MDINFIGENKYNTTSYQHSTEAQTGGKTTVISMGSRSFPITARVIQDRNHPKLLGQVFRTEYAKHPDILNIVNKDNSEEDGFLITTSTRRASEKANS